ncbi:MAG: hypothetical protein ACTHQQ_13125 [Solirubrobacteraceae bacterium]
MSSFPAVVGPLLLITYQERGPAFAARTATGTLLGLVGLAAFVLAYAWAATRAGWVTSLIAGWTTAGLVTVTVDLTGAPALLPVGFVAAVVATASAQRALPRRLDQASTRASDRAFRGELPLQMGVTAALVVLLAGASELLGPLVGGVLAGLPVLASVLAVFTHRRNGTLALVDMLHGMLTGMAGFVAFCAVIALTVVPAGVPAAFVGATVAVVILQAVPAHRMGSRQRQQARSSA